MTKSFPGKHPRRRKRLKFKDEIEEQPTPIWVYVVWMILISGSLYFPFIKSPEMTESQLLINYWWFYTPAMLVIIAITVGRRRR